LAYVIHEDEEVPDGPDNDYQDAFEEMIAQCPHEEESYAADNAQVWSIIRVCAHGGSTWSWLSAYAQACNGRAAWFALCSHYLGPTNQSKIMMRAEGDLESKSYNRERRNFTFECFAEIHQQAHTDLEEFGEPLTEAAKVRKFLKRIQASFLNSAIATVCANLSLKNDFEATVNFLSEFIEEQNQAQLRNISSGRSGRGRGQGRGLSRGNRGCGGRGDKSVFNRGSTKGMVDKYYTFDEYKSMNPEQKRHLHMLRQEAGGKCNASTVDSQEKEDDKKFKTGRDNTSSITSKSSAGRNMSQRNSNMSVVSTRSISIQSLESTFISHAELDSHADTCCIGKNAYIFHETSRMVDVSAFLSTLGQAQSVPIVSAALAYDHPYTYETFILIIHQALHFPTMEHNLLNPNQLRLNNVQVYDCPRFLLENPTDLSHSIYFPNENLKLHLQLDGVISYLPVRKPSPEEFQNFHKLTLTYDNPIWDPYSTDFTRQEEKYTDSKGILVTRQSGHANIQMISSHESTVSVVLSSISVSLDEQHFVEALEKTCLVSVAQSSNYRYRVTPEELARRWNIGLSAAKRTLLATTQRGVKDIASRTLTQRVKPTTSQLRYRHLRTSVYTDTMFACVMSLSGNTCAQIYVNNLDWTRAYAMKSKGNAHETLDLLFHREGVPAEIISDGAKELVQGEFRRKVRAAGSHARQIEPYSPWLNRAETAIRALKRMTNMAMKKSSAPLYLWDFCLELQSMIRSSIAHNIYALNDNVPNTAVSGDTTDISHLCEFAWYDWIWYLDPVDFPVDKRNLGRWLGPAHDIGDVMCARILVQSGQVVSQTSYSPLSTADLNSREVQLDKSSFDATLSYNNCDDAIAPVFPEEVNVFCAYSDDSTGDEPTMPQADELDHKAFDEYLDAQVVLPYKDIATTGTVIARKKDRDGNVVGKSHPNPVLDTRVMEVQFPDGNVQEFAANVIAEHLYSQVDDEGRRFRIVDEIIDHFHGNILSYEMIRYRVTFCGWIGSRT
jgi:hypothetical protein